MQVEVSRVIVAVDHVQVQRDDRSIPPSRSAAPEIGRRRARAFVARCMAADDLLGICLVPKIFKILYHIEFFDICMEQFKKIINYTV